MNRDGVKHRLHKKSAPKLDASVLNQLFAQNQAEGCRRQSLQGKGRPIISADVNGYKVVATGRTVHYSKADATKTFIDFLHNYLISLFTSDWGNNEIAKPLEERHTIMKWYDGQCKLQPKQHKSGEIISVPRKGVLMAYNALAYNLYLLDHNAEVQEHLIKRLKNDNEFYPAYYETHVAAWFVLAGFKLTLENENDPSTSHCEFTAEAPSGKRYSVEAKSCKACKDHFAIGNQLIKALKKRADHSRIICIDMNVRQEIFADKDSYAREVVSHLRGKESTKISGKPAPPAYVFVTNIPDHLHLDDDSARRAILADGFKIDDFGFKEYQSLTETFKARQKHADVYSVCNAFDNYSIPATFDGELPEFAFGEAERRFNIGDHYKLDEKVVGLLTHGGVLEVEKKAYLNFLTIDGKTHLYEAKLSNAELSAYIKHPETFFGSVQPIARKAETPLQLFEFFYNSCKDTPKAKLLEWLADAPNFEQLQKLPLEDLVFEYAESSTIIALQNDPSRNSGANPMT